MKKTALLLVVCGILAGLFPSGAQLIPADGDLQGIMICSLPETGALSLDGTPISCGTTILTGDLPRLIYTPSARTAETFAYIEVFDSGTVGAPITCALPASFNRAPLAEPATLVSWRDLTACAVLSAVDPDGDALEYRIVSAPKKGCVELVGNEITYTPYKNKTGDDSFTYIVRDSYGAWSEETSVSVEIKRRDAPVNYADMQANRAQYAAVRLYDAGIYAGAVYGGVACFAPDEVLTRGEFAAMALAAAGIEPIACASTGFDDDASIPVWTRGYIAAASARGLLQGYYNAAGVLECRADAAITVEEAAAILDRISGETIQSVISVSTADSSAPLTRADAAIMLCSTIDAQETEKKLGLFRWTRED